MSGTGWTRAAFYCYPVRKVTTLGRISFKWEKIVVEGVTWKTKKEMVQKSDWVAPNLNFEGEIFLHVFDDHDEVRKLDAEGLSRVGRTSDVGGAHVGADDLQNEALDVRVRDPLDVAVPDLLVPYLQWLAADAVQDGQEPALERVLEHFSQLVLLSRKVGGKTRAAEVWNKLPQMKFVPAFSFLLRRKKPEQVLIQHKHWWFTAGPIRQQLLHL